MKFSNKVYDTFKWIAQYLLPACATLYFAIADLWHLPYVAEVVGTISAVDAFIGILLGISSANYEGDGQILFKDQDSLLSLDITQEALKRKDMVTLKIVNTETEV